MSTQARAEWWQPRAAAGSAVQAGAMPVERPGSRTAFWSLIVFTVILILEPQGHFPILQPLHLAFVSAALAGGAYLYDRYVNNLPVVGGSREMQIVVALVGWAAITVPFSVWPGGSAGQMVDMFFKTLVIFWLLGRVVTTVPRLKIVAWTLTLVSVPLALSGVNSFLTGAYYQQVSSNGLERISGYQSGLTGNPNDLAMMINLILPMTLALIFCARGAAVRVLLGVLAVLDMVAVVATFSRGGFLMMAVVVGSFLVALWRRGYSSIVIAATVLAVAVTPFVLPSGYTGRLSTITSIQSDQTGSEQDRWHDMVNAGLYALGHPIIGVGVGQSQLVLNRFRSEATWRKVHNVYLQYAMDLGFPGLLLFLLLMYGVLDGCRRVCRSTADRPEQSDFHFLTLGVGISLFGFAVAALFYPDAFQFYFFYFAGLAVAIKAIASRRGTGPTVEMPRGA